MLAVGTAAGSPGGKWNGEQPCRHMLPVSCCCVHYSDSGHQLPAPRRHLVLLSLSGHPFLGQEHKHNNQTDKGMQLEGQRLAAAGEGTAP
jgi:hypothetical protein